MPIIFSNNASSLLATSIDTITTSIQVSSGDGDALFPNPGVGESFYITLENDQGDVEVCQCTSRAADVLTVVRGRDNTAAQAFTQLVTRVEVRLTAIVVEEFLQRSGDLLTGDLDFNGNAATDVVINGPLTQMTAGEIVGVPLRGTAGLSANEIAIVGAGAPTIGGVPILKSGDDIVAELDTAGVINLNSATIGVLIPAGAYLRIEGTTTSEFMQVAHDDTDINFTFGNVTEVNFPAALNITGNITLTGDMNMNEGTLSDIQVINYGVVEQSVTATATTDLDYTAGSYVNLALNVNITTLTFSNLPTAGVASFRLKVTQGSGGQTITWPASVKWPNNGSAPTLSTAASEIDFIDLWSDDQGTTWYGAYNLDWA